MSDEAPRDTEYPRMLYRFDKGGIEIHEVPCETLVVSSSDEEDEATADGFYRSPAECKPKEKPAVRRPTPPANEADEQGAAA